MPDHSSATDSPRQIGVFELARLRRTDSLADPVSRARCLCRELSHATDCERVSFVLTGGSGCLLVATSTTPAPDRHCEETWRLESVAAQVQASLRDVSHLTDGVEFDSPQWLAIPITGRDDCDVVASIVLQRYAFSPTSIEQSLSPIRPCVNTAAVDIAASWRGQHRRRDHALTRFWNRLNTRRRVGTVAAAFAAVLLIAWIPVPLRLPVDGRLQPAITHNVYAPAAGLVTRLHVRDGQAIRRGELLAEMSSVDVGLQFDRIHGELAASQTELATLRLNQADEQGSSGGSRTDASTRNASSSGLHSSSARRMVLRARIESLTAQAALIDEVRRSLSMHAKIDGRVKLNDAQSELAGQNVLPSQWLMQIVDPESGYQAILDLPEQHYGYVHDRIAARNKAGSADKTGSADSTSGAGNIDVPVHATMRLRSSPDVVFGGTAIGVADTVQWNERGIAAVEITIAVTDPLPGGVQSSGSVTGSLDAGRRSLGFVLFRPLLEFLRSYGW